MLRRLLNWLTEPLVQNVDVNSSDLVKIHRDILTRKSALRGVFEEFYHLARNLDETYFTGDGLRVELGAGSSFFKSLYPDILSTDVKPAPHLDEVVDALSMPYGANSVRTLYGFNCFHHFPDPEVFFVEARRVLVPGGGVILIEPYFSVFASWFYRRVFATEHFNENQKEWRTETQGPMTGANQALSYIVFVRDQKEFQAKFPNLKICYHKTLTNYPRYLLSGGLNFRLLVPDALIPLVKLIEVLLTPFHRFFGLHHIIVIRKDP